MSAYEDWRKHASVVLDEFELGVRKGRLTLTEISQIVGVARQTIWRDKSIMQRIDNIRNIQPSIKHKNPGRADLIMRFRLLEIENKQLEVENGILVQNIMIICRRLIDLGLDPYSIISQNLKEIDNVRREYLSEN
ncbi:hypothetical protein [Deefgea rivuli]|uniref:hypothetical protein n=1 Tax=Deefgea rivuli TaxID=400948 RepID=UPI0004898705|nr:hypothetical protein [Deefgea rivuli]